MADLERRASQSSGAASGQGGAEDPDAIGLGDNSITDNITDNIQYIAGSIEKVLQELQLEVGKHVMIIYSMCASLECFQTVILPEHHDLS